MIAALVTVAALLAAPAAKPVPAPATTPAPAPASTAGRSAPAAARINVAFIDIGEPARFWNVVVAAAQAAAKSLDIELEILNAHGDHLKMVDFARELAARPNKPDYALINNEKGTGGRMLEVLTAAHIQTLVIMNVLDAPDVARFGRPREKLKEFLGTLRPDNVGAGTALARRLAEAAHAQFKPPIRVLAISGAKATPAASDRDRGLTQALAADHDLILEQLVHSNWQRDKAHMQLAGLLRRWPDTKVIWAANDPMALGALDAVTERHQAPGKDILVGGLNWSIDALRLVQSGQLVCSAGGHFLGAAWALVLIRDHHDGKDFASEGTELEFPMGLIDRGNVEPYLMQFGDQKWSRIDFAKFSKSRNPAVSKYEFTLAKVLEQFAGH